MVAALGTGRDWARRSSADLYVVISAIYSARIALASQSSMLGDSKQ